jgi:hypothetical protein
MDYFFNIYKIVQKYICDTNRVTQFDIQHNTVNIIWLDFGSK